MYLRQDLHVLLICLVIFLKNEVLAAHNDKICLTSNIIGFELVKHCGNDTSVSTYVGHGSICTIKCKNTSHFVNVSCENGIWTDKCTRFDNRQLISRKRRSFFHSLRCFFWRDWSCRQKSDTSPPVLIGCHNVTATAEKLKLYQNVHWKLPTVSDNGIYSRLSVHTSPRPPGSIYFAGTTKASHFALDRHGNLGKCNFNINVKVITCEPIKPVSGGYIQCFPGNSRIYGTTCRVSCNKGYILEGKSNFECTEDGYWSIFPIPSCQRVTCDKLILTSTQTIVNCTDQNYYGSKCTYDCKKGYGIQQDQSRVLYCKSNGQWSTIQPICKDVFPPKWLNCPVVPYIQFADRNKDTAKLELRTPDAKDDVDGPITAILLSGPRRGEVVKTGSHVSIYVATDRTGNQAKQCHVKTVVRQITCPKLFNKPYTKIICENGNRYGATCKYECADGSLLRGLSVVVCEKNTGNSYGFWRWGNFEPYCEVMETCALKLGPPANGALACDYWFGGKFCQMQCRKGYDVDPAYRMNQMYVCSEEGRWLPSTYVPDCTKAISVSTASTLVSIYYYFNGNCNDEAVQNEIRENFINAFKNSLYSQACEEYLDRCKVENVQVLCGTQSRKRSASMIKLQFKLKLTSSEPLTPSTLLEFSHHFKLANNTEDFKIHLNGSTKLIPLEISQTSPEIICPKRLVPSYTTSSCAECQKGTFYDVETQSCRICPKGRYQNQSSAEVCVACPMGTTTEFEGSTIVDDCRTACTPGYWSTNGISPCMPCDQGTFQHREGSTECIKCGHGKTTTRVGTKSSLDCKEFDIVFSNRTKEGGIAINFSNIDIVRNFKLSMWIKMTDMTKTFEILQIDDETINVGIVYQSEIFHLLTSCFEVGVISMLRSWNFVSLTVYKEHILFQVNNQQKNITKSCIKITTNASIHIGSNFTGKISQLNIWSVNGSDNDLLAFGESCMDNKPGDILSWKQFESIETISTTYIEVPSECDDVDDCLNETCKFGHCIDMLNNHLCVCNFGFTGIDCDENIDDCVGNICENNATCIDNIGSYDCLCDDGYKGDYCEIIIVNGSWTEWNEWSHCSKSCGVGERTRSRFCNNPPSLNGGRECNGNSTQIENCVIESCKSCNNWTAPDNALLLCVNETDKDAINCTLTCNDGFEFDSPPRKYFYCGPSTFYFWEFETDDNPAKRIPSCNEVKNASELIVIYNIVYSELVCNNAETSQLVEWEMQRLLNLTRQNVKCIEENVCHLNEFQLLHCQQEIQKRDIFETPVQLQAKMTCDPNQYGEKVCGKVLVEAVDILKSFSLTGALNINLNHTEFEVSANSTSIGTDIICPKGNEKVSYYCVPCGEGKYHDGNACKKCDFGQYQFEHGKSICNKCPKNYTTLGRGSVSVNECIDNIPPEFNGSCPKNITEFIDIQSVAKEVSWTAPVPVDNSEDQLILQLISGRSPGSMFAVNTSSLVQYIATDKSGNNSTCTFYVHVKVQTEGVQIKGLLNSDTDTTYVAILGGSIAVCVMIIAVVIASLLLKRRMETGGVRCLNF